MTDAMDPGRTGMIIKASLSDAISCVRVGGQGLGQTKHYFKSSLYRRVLDFVPCVMSETPGFVLDTPGLGWGGTARLSPTKNSLNGSIPGMSGFNILPKVIAATFRRKLNPDMPGMEPFKEFFVGLNHAVPPHPKPGVSNTFHGTKSKTLQYKIHLK